MRLNRILVLATVLLAAAGCGSKNRSDAEVAFGFQDSQVRDITLRELKRKEIWHQVVGPNRIKVRVDELDSIALIVQGITESIIPHGRAANYSQALHEEFTNRLNLMAIPYRVVRYGDLDVPPNGQEMGFTTDWIVWEEEYASEVERVQSAMEKDFLDSAAYGR